MNPKYPCICAKCDMEVQSEAEAFIHACLHSKGEEWTEFGKLGKLNTLPFIFFPIVAKLMETYKRLV